VESIDEVLQSLMTMVRGLLIEARTLWSIREELLPKLVSGEVRVAAELAEGGESAA
jgi:hypothetical protein